jgi:Fe(3+) dicitrate transport protein
MNRLLQYILVLVCSAFAISLQAQFKLSGVVKSTTDTTHVGICKVILNNGAFVTSTDSLGYFEFKDLPNGAYQLTTSTPYFKPAERNVIINDKDEEIVVSVVPDFITLKEVVVEKRPEADPNYMKGVENMGIYEGKKSEVIIPDKLVANLATNNARQVYSRVAGLNIWENDGAGLQLSVGGRGLDPNRTSNFNVRQNGYDISADALGYPESYYTPPIEAIDRIQIVRGAASLQYGTQFGGLLNFVMRKPVADKKIQLVARQTLGSYGFYNSFTSVS